MTNAVTPPNLVLGVLENPGGMSQFLDYEARRRRETQDAPSAEEWYKSNKAKHPFIIDTIGGDSTLISFKMTFGKVANSQTACTIEFIDPANRIEALIMASLFGETTSYASNLNKVILDARKSWLDYTDEKNPPIIPGSPSTDPDVVPFRANPAKFKKAGESLKKISQSAGFTKPLAVVFGAGDDLRTWSPATSYRIATIDYGLTPNGVKKFILNLVVSPGALAWDQIKEKDVEKLTDAGKTKIGWIDPKISFIRNFQEHTGWDYVSDDTPQRRGDPPRAPAQLVQTTRTRLDYSNPVDIYINLWKEATGMLIKQSPLILLDGVVGALNKKWSDALYTAIINNVKSAYGKHKIVSAAGGKVAEDLDTFAKDLAKRINDQSSTAPFAEFDLYTGEDHPPTFAYSPGSPWWGARAVGPDELAQRWAESLVEYQKTYGKTTGADLLRRLTGSEVDRDILWGTSTQEAILNDISPWSMNDQGRIVDESGNLAPKGWDQDLPYQLFMIRDDMQRMLSGEQESDRALWGRRIQSRPQYELGRSKLEEILLKQMVLGVGKVSPHILRIKELKTVGLYKILVAAATQFFSSPFRLEVVQPAGKSMVVRGINMYENLPTDQIGKTPQENIEDVGTPPVNIHLKIEDAPHTFRAKMKSTFAELGGTKDLDIICACFSEISFVSKFGSLFENKFGKPLAYESIDLITTYSIFYSLVNGDNLIKKNKGSPLFTREGEALYTIFFEAFKFYVAGENDPNIAKVAFGERFSHPDAVTLLLDTTDGNFNFVTPVESASNKSDFSKIKTNEDFRNILTQHNIPVFNYGFKNSNIINFNMELKLWYAHLLSIIPQIVNTGRISGALGDAKANASIMDLYKNQDSPRKIKKALSDYYDDNFGRYMKSGAFLKGDLHGVYMSPEVQNNSSYIALINTLGQEHLKVGGYDSKSIFIETMETLLELNWSFPEVASKYFVDYNNQDNVIDLIANIRDKLSNRTFKGTIETLPLYSRCSTINSVGRKCLLYFVEPEITNAKGDEVRSTWLSGLYTTVGFSFTMDNRTVKTSFSVVREGSSAMGLREK